MEVTPSKPTELTTLELEFKEAPKPIEVPKPLIPWRGPDDFEVVIEKIKEVEEVTTEEVVKEEVTIERAPTEEVPERDVTTLEIEFDEKPKPEITMAIQMPEERKPEG